MGLTFLALLAGGMFATLATLPVSQVSFRFVRTVTLIGLALVVSLEVWLVLGRPLHADHQILAWSALGLGALLGGVQLSLMMRLPHSAEAIRFVAGAAGATILCGAFVVSRGLGIWPHQGGTVATLAGFNMMLGTAVLGTVTLSWLLGHAYLTATDMSLDPLRRLGRMFSIAVWARCAFAVVSLVIVYASAASGGEDAGVHVGVLERLGWSFVDVLYICVRAGVGLLPLPIMAWMVGDCIKARNTQSTTGVLYFASVLAYIGELSSLHLMSTTGLPM